MRSANRPYYYRNALLVPLILPILVLISIIPGYLAGARTFYWPEPVFGLAILVVVGGAIYVVPYAVLVAFLWARLPSMSLRRQRQLLVLTPPMLGLVAPVALALLQLGQSTRWWDGCLEIYLFSLAVGYGYAIPIGLVEVVTTRRLELLPPTGD